jgi:hypothetical protein
MLYGAWLTAATQDSMAGAANDDPVPFNVTAAPAGAEGPMIVTARPTMAAAATADPNRRARRDRVRRRERSAGT